MSKRKRYDLKSRPSHIMGLLAQITYQRLEVELRKLGLTRQKFFVLLALAEEDLVNPTEIARFIGVNKTTVSRLLLAMETDGLVTRNSASDDGRSTTVTISPKASAILVQAIPQAALLDAHLKAKLSFDDFETFKDILEKLAEGETSF